MINIEIKGAYGWMLFLIQNQIEDSDVLIELYQEDQYMIIEGNDETYVLWRVGFENKKKANEAFRFLQNRSIQVIQKGRWLEIKIKQ